MTVSFILLALLVAVWGAVALAARTALAMSDGVNYVLHRYLDTDRDVLVRSIAEKTWGRVLELPFAILLGIPLVLGIWVFFGILDEVAEADRLVDLDKTVFGYLSGLRTPNADKVMIAVTGLGDAAVVLAVAFAAVAVLAFAQRSRAILFLITAIAGAAAFVGGIKRFIHRPRPLAMYDGVAEYSFPSGHATMSVVLYGFVAILLLQSAPARWRREIAFGTLSLIVMIGFSRVYLGAHWLSDVVAGMAFGVSWVSLLALLYWRVPQPQVPPLLFAAVTAGTLVIAGGVHYVRDIASQASRYTRPQPAAKLNTNGAVIAASGREWRARAGRGDGS